MKRGGTELRSAVALRILVAVGDVRDGLRNVAGGDGAIVTSSARRDGPRYGQSDVRRPLGAAIFVPSGVRVACRQRWWQFGSISDLGVRFGKKQPGVMVIGSGTRGHR